MSEPKSTRPSTEPQEWNERNQWILDEYSDLFPASLPPGLPPQRETDIKIELVPGAPVVYQRQYQMSPPESAELTRQVEVHKHGERVQSSMSPYNAPSIMERKIGTNELRWCVDFRGINRYTIPDPYPMPIAEQLIERMSGAMYISKIDFLNGYFQTRVHPDSVKYTAFSTEFEHLERVRPIAEWSDHQSPTHPDHGSNPFPSTRIFSTTIYFTPEIFIPCFFPDPTQLWVILPEPWSPRRLPARPTSHKPFTPPIIHPNTPPNTQENIP